MRSQVYRNGQTAYIGNIRRTKFVKNPKRVITTMNIGKLYPIRWEECLPGSNWKSDTSLSATLTSAYLRPVKDDLFVDFYHFKIPCRILDEDYERVFGNPNPSAYVDADLLEIPVTTSRQNVVSKSVADYLGLPVGSLPKGISILPFRAFAMIYNEWFRNQQVDGEVLIQMGSSWSSSSEAFNANAWSPSNYTGMLPNVTRMKDYFSVAIPSPQKGQPVPLGFTAGWQPLDSSNTVVPFPSGLSMGLSTDAGGGITSGRMTPLYIAHEAPAFGGSRVRSSATEGEVEESAFSVTGSNLGIDMSSITTTNVNDFRMAFVLQRMQELDIYGGRYREYLLAHYNVNNNDARMQIPEFLGGKRVPLNNQTVAQTSQPSTESPLGALAGYSDTAVRRAGGFSTAITEHCYIMTVACIRQRHTYQQGIQPKWTRKSRVDFYDPCFAHIGNQPIWQSELYAVGKSDLKDNVFGYKEAWSEYKQSFNEVTGEARTAAANSLDIYHFADNYSNAPVLGQQFIEETSDYVARTLAVAPTEQDPFIVDWCFRDTVVLPMPLNCDPGLI